MKKEISKILEDCWAVNLADGETVQLTFSESQQALEAKNFLSLIVDNNKLREKKCD